MSFGEPACPACGLRPATGAACGACGWVLTTDWLPGPADRAGFDRRLAEHRMRLDLRAAALAGTATLPYVRGTPDEQQWRQACEDAARDRVTAEHELAAALRGMGEYLAVIEAGPDGVSTLFIQARDLDTAAPLRLRQDVPWREIAPMLATGPDELRFQLAGGLHRVDRTQLAVSMERALMGVVERVHPETPTVFVCTAPGWAVPEQAVAILRRLRPNARAATSSLPVAEELPAAIARQPLRATYSLILAEEGPAGTRPIAVPLFARGGFAGLEARVDVVRGPGAADTDLALAVIVDAPPGEHREPVSVRSAKLPPGASTLRAVLEGPGRVRWLEPAETGTESRSLHELYAQTQANSVASGYAEVMCAVELGGPPDQAAMRRELIAGTLELLASDLPDRVRVAVFGYYEHSFKLGEEHKQVVDGVWLSEPQVARDAFAALPEATGGWQDDAAPLEDALAEILARIEPGRAPRTLLVVAGRPPHPRRLGQDPDRELAQPCPRRNDWQVIHAGLRRAGMRFVAVLDKETTIATGAWRELGADHRAVLEELRPDDLAAALGLVAADAPGLPFPLKPKGDPA
jgi:hypothetical protein